MTFDDFEFNPISAGVGILGGVLALVVMSKVEVGLLYKLLSFAITCVLSYIVFDKIMSR